MDVQDWFTLEGLGAFAGAVLALRVWVQVTKHGFDALWQWITGHRPRTAVYALVWSAVIVYGVHWFMGMLTPAQAFVDVFNVAAVALVAGVLGPQDGSGESESADQEGGAA